MKLLYTLTSQVASIFLLPYESYADWKTLSAEVLEASLPPARFFFLVARSTSFSRRSNLSSSWASWEQDRATHRCSTKHSDASIQPSIRPFFLMFWGGGGGGGGEVGRLGVQDGAECLLHPTASVCSCGQGMVGAVEPPKRRMVSSVSGLAFAGSSTWIPPARPTSPSLNSRRSSN